MLDLDQGVLDALGGDVALAATESREHAWTNREYLSREAKK